MTAAPSWKYDLVSDDRSGPIVEIALPSIPGFEKVARDAAAVVADQMGFSPDRIEDLKTAVAEACLNAAEHGNAGDATAEVRVVMRVAESSLSVSVNDQGRGILPRERPGPGFPDRQRGWGMFFIDRLMDRVIIARLPEGGNQVTMEIRLAPTSAQPSSWPSSSADGADDGSPEES